METDTRTKDIIQSCDNTNQHIFLTDYVINYLSVFVFDVYNT